MWFENALNKEKIVHMLGGELNIDCVEFIGFNFNEVSSLKITLVIKGLPHIYPKKWDEEYNNALILTLGLVGVKKLRIEGSQINFFCSPKINSTAEHSDISIKSETFDFYCESQIINIVAISPYCDERWD